MPQRYIVLKSLAALIFTLASVVSSSASPAYYDDRYDAHDLINRVLIYQPQTGPENFNTDNKTTGAPPPNLQFNYPLTPNNFPNGVLQVNDQTAQQNDTGVLTVYIQQTDFPNSLHEKMTIEQAHEHLQTISDKYKGTGDLSGVAKALYDFNQLYKACNGEEWFRWDGDSKEGGEGQDKLIDNLSKPEAFLFSRDMACYEFVHFSAWISSDRPTMKNGTYVRWTLVPHVTANAHYVPVGPDKGWIGKGFVPAVSVRGNTDTIPAGQVIIGVGRWSNNGSYYNHTGISIGDGKVIALGSGGLVEGDISNKLGAGGVFWSLGYTDIYADDYAWAPQNPAPAALSNPAGGTTSPPSGGETPPQPAQQTPVNPPAPAPTGH